MKTIASIDSENFSAAWNQANKAHRRAKKSLATSRIVNTAGLLLFALCSYVTVLFGLYRWAPEGLRALAELMPRRLELWQSIESAVLSADTTTFQYAVFYLGCAAMPALIFSLTAAVLVQIFYVPAKESLPTDSLHKDSTALVLMLERARATAQKARKTRSLLFYIGFLVLAVLTCLWAFRGENGPANWAAVAAGLSADGVKTTLLTLVGLVALLVVLYRLFDLVTGLLYRCRIPYESVAQAWIFHATADEQTEGLTPEQIAQNRKSRANELLCQAMEKDRIGDYPGSRPLFAQAACLGSVPAMDRMARFHIVSDPECAIYWYQRCLDSGEALPGTAERLQRVKRGQRVDVNY